MGVSTGTIQGATEGFPESFAAAGKKAGFKTPSYEANTLSNAEWDAIAADFEDVSYEQTAAYCCAKWGDKNNSHLLLREGNDVIAAARVLEYKFPGVEKGLAYVKFGPLWRRANRQPDPNVYQSILAALSEEYCTGRGLVLSILPRASAEFTTREQVMLEASGFTNRRPLEFPERYLVNLSLDEEEQMASLGQSWRRNLKKSASSNLEIGFGQGNRAFEQFQSLHDSMVRRKNAAHGDAVHMVPHLEDSLPESLAPKTVIALHEGAPIAGAIIALNGDTAYYIYGATARKALPLRAGYALQWWIIRWLTEQGVSWYDLGGTSGDSGLVQFKTGLAGRQGRIVELPGEYLKWNRRVDLIAADAMFSLRDCYRSVARLQLPRVWR